MGGKKYEILARKVLLTALLDCYFNLSKREVNRPVCHRNSLSILQTCGDARMEVLRENTNDSHFGFM